MPNAQLTFDQEYPFTGLCLEELDRINHGRTRSEIIEIDLSRQYLEGPLVIKDFPNLEEIRFISNHLTSLEFINCPNVKKVNC